MVETKVPKDIRTYKTKLVGPLSLRETICVLIVCVIDWIAYSFFFKPLDLSADMLIYAIMFLDLPILAFGGIRPMGMPLEKYIMMIFVTQFMSPKHRKVVTKIVKINDQVNISDKEKRKQKKIFKNEIKDNPEFKPYK